MPRSKIIQEDENYIHAEFRSRIFRFVDDVELWIPDDAKEIHQRFSHEIEEIQERVNQSVSVKQVDLVGMQVKEKPVGIGQFNGRFSSSDFKIQPCLFDFQFLANPFKFAFLFSIQDRETVAS